MRKFNFFITFEIFVMNQYRYVTISNNITKVTELIVMTA